MNILVINPPSPESANFVREGRCMQRADVWGTSWPPISLAIISALLRENGFTVKLIDSPSLGVTFKDLEKIINDFSPYIIVSNTSTPTIVNDLEVATLAKKINSNIKTIFWGIHPSALPEETFLENNDLEYIAIGEPEYTILDFAKNISEKTDLNSVKGLAYREKNKIKINEKREIIDNLDELPFPAWDLIRSNDYQLPLTGKPFLLALTGRGCPNCCNFCSAGTLYGNRSRLRSPGKIVSELEYIKENFQVNDFLFWAENSISNKNHMLEISKLLINKKLNIKFVCNSRVDIIDDNLMKTMKKAGCWMIGFGVESGSQKILDAMGKKIRLEQIEAAIRATKKNNIQVTAHVMIGYPGETKENIKETIRFLKKCNPEFIQVYCAVPFPGSKLFDEQKKSSDILKYPWEKFEQHQSIINTVSTSSKYVMKMRKKMLFNYYFRPAKIINTILNLNSFSDIYRLGLFSKNYFISLLDK